MLFRACKWVFKLVDYILFPVSNSYFEHAAGFNHFEFPIGWENLLLIISMFGELARLFNARLSVCRLGIPIIRQLRSCGPPAEMDSFFCGTVNKRLPEVQQHTCTRTHTFTYCTHCHWKSNNMVGGEENIMNYSSIPTGCSTWLVISFQWVNVAFTRPNHNAQGDLTIQRWSGHCHELTGF